MGIEKCSFIPNGFNELALCRGGPRLYNKHDVYVGGALARYGEFSLSESLLFEQLLRPGAIVIEAGANIGAHTVDIARIVGPTGQVYAFEPQRLVFQALCANLALNQLSNVFAYQAGVGAQTGSITVPYLPPTETHNFGGLSIGSGPVGDVVPLATIDALDLAHCHFIKVDVEGMETEVLQGGLRTIDRYRPLMYLENDRKERSRDLLSLIERLDYDAYWHFARFFNPGNFAGNPVNDFPPDLVSINVLCVPRELKMAVEGLRRVSSVDETFDALR
ncbi:MAG: FkbM family methyltransferase [Burkholderiales bacterium]|nr:FkbM family methyltransferase [Burkholderiales bacterium]